MDDASALPKDSKNTKVVSKGLPAFKKEKMIKKSSQSVADNVFTLMQQQIYLQRSKKGGIYMGEIMKDSRNETKTGTDIVKIERATIANLETECINSSPAKFRISHSQQRIPHSCLSSSTYQSFDSCGISKRRANILLHLQAKKQSCTNLTVGN